MSAERAHKSADPAAIRGHAAQRESAAPSHEPAAAPFVRVAGVLQADTLITNSVVSSSYTPGAGNVA
jgi:hypothetical protein